MNTKILIGEMAKLHQVSTQTLRYYDKIGLFKPLYTDEENNYRFYGIEQFAHLDSILFLKSVGMSLKDIQKFFQNRNIKSAKTLLRDKFEQIDKEILLLKKRKKSIQKKLELLDEYKDESIYGKCRLVDMPLRQILYMPFTKSKDDVEFEYGLKTLASFIQEDLFFFNSAFGIMLQKIDYEKPYGMEWKGVVLILEDDSMDETFVKNVMYDKENYRDTRYDDVQIIPKGTFATITYLGGYTQGEIYLNKLLHWMNDHQLHPVGDPLMLTIIDAAFSSFEEEYITEIQIPIEVVNTVE